MAASIRPSERALSAENAASISSRAWASRTEAETPPITTAMMR
ncbi:hypothetical protein [Oceanicaulis sp.]|nr:hypothetical protein [Oceanicaulis sp.]